MKKFGLFQFLFIILFTSSCTGTKAVANETWTLVELLSIGERTDVVTEVVEVRNCGAPERKTTSCSAGTSNDLSVSLSGGLQFGEGVVGTIGADVTAGLGMGRESGESLELELPPSDSIFQYTIKKTYQILAGKVLARSSSGKEQEAAYAFHASCSISIQSIPETLSCKSEPVDQSTNIPTPLSPKTTSTEAQGVEMAFIPAGEFLMGGKDDYDESPLHSVYLDEYYIDVYEITNEFYAVCVQAGVCQPPGESKSYTRSSYYDDPAYADYPVIYLDWEQARTYCHWRGGDLPTEAQWEKAARGGLEGKRYSWGDETLDCAKANYFDCEEDTIKVGSYPPNGFGLYDIAGNVYEWIQDWYDGTYYSSQSAWRNPFGPLLGEYRVIRGGSWKNDVIDLLVAFRGRYTPSDRSYHIGLRCARTP